MPMRPANPDVRDVYGTVAETGGQIVTQCRNCSISGRLRPVMVAVGGRIELA